MSRQDEDAAFSRDLEKAVVRWIRAEFHFRQGVYAFEEGPTDAYFEAEAHLRNLAVGRKTLRGAAKAIGIDVEKVSEQREGRLRARRKPARSRPSRKRAKLPDPPENPGERKKKRVRLEEPPKRSRKRRGLGPGFLG